MTRVKICGVRDLPTAMNSIDAGADCIGFNFVPESRRFIQPSAAKAIIKQLPAGSVAIVGVFRDTPLDVVNQVANDLGLDTVQLHGQESPAFADAIELSVIKAVTVPSGADATALARYMSKFGKDTIFLLDRAIQGTGDPVDPAIAAELALRFRVMVAGGLTPGTVPNVIRAAHPYGVDVAGGVERDGAIDPALVRLFIRQVRAAAERHKV